MATISEAEILRRREEYFALPTDQERADYLWNFGKGGAVLRLSPSDYPKCQPRHKRCAHCGGRGTLERHYNGAGLSVDTFSVECRQCGRHTERFKLAFTAWRQWDDGKIGNVDGQLSLFDMMGGES